MPWPFAQKDPLAWRRNLTILERRDELLGAVVFCIQCDGCMGSDHKMKWMGIVERLFDKGNYTYATVKIVKQDHRDWRDGDLGAKQVNTSDPSLQHLGPKLFCWYR